ncbi:MAG: CerR family C-terminal domain-containing protein [Pseudomonadota bacterium]
MSENTIEYHHVSSLNTGHNESDTRTRLLMAAAQEFAKHGYEAATVRSICREAEANVAAVKYHFGSKDRLYAEVLLSFFSGRSAQYPLESGFDTAKNDEERLELFIGNFLRCLCCESEADSAHARLVLSEIVNPTPLFAELVTAVMEPIRRAIEMAVRPLLGEQLDDNALRACLVGVLGQVLFYLQNRSIIENMYEDVVFDEEGLKRITRHITQFSLGGIMRCAQRCGGAE